jgi:hypothetical protein
MLLYFPKFVRGGAMEFLVPELVAGRSPNKSGMAWIGYPITKTKGQKPRESIC